MSEHPILFSGEMVRAILDGRKTQTRRPVKPQPEGCLSSCEWYAPMRISRQGEEYPGKAVYGCYDDEDGWVSPFGSPGDTLWVRETWGFAAGDFEYLAIQYAADRERLIISGKDIRDYPNQRKGMKPSIHMPRWASRITLSVTGVRVERIQDISEEDARDEGIDTHAYSWPEGTTPNHARDCGGLYRNGFRNLWDSIYADKGFGWDDNPWVWVGEFEQYTSK